MKIINASYRIETPIYGEELLKSIEKAGRTCYKSEDRITEESAKVFVRKLIERGHESVLEHESITVRFICDRGISVACRMRLCVTDLPATRRKAPAIATIAATGSEAN